ncbi:MAG: lysophospholipid acyltransferase family protein [Verrucomicrobiota bacterium]|nr:lysophospholipid acyltransferase family protein [Verrucomicrobiota bacterium]
MTPLYWMAWSTSRLVFRNLFRCRVYHPEHVPLNGPVILAANHESYLDPPLIGSSLSRPVHYLARENLFSNRLFGPFLRGLNSVPVDRDGGSAKGLKNILERLLNGDAILIFPEGTRTKDGTIQPARAGIGLAILKSHAPVVPVRVWAYNTYGRHRSVPRPGMIAVKFGHPMPFDSVRKKAKACPRTKWRSLYQQVTDETMSAIASLQPIRDDD